MLTSIDRATRVLATTALLGTLLLVSPSQAQTAQSPSSQAPAAQSAADPVEGRIAELHDKLKITPAQEAKWKAVAQVMRDNAKKMHALLERRGQNLRSMTAVDDLKSYRDITEAHSQGLKKLIIVFDELYKAMPPAQKKGADQVFAKFQEPGAPEPAAAQSGGTK
jgi:protein CpxP